MVSCPEAGQPVISSVVYEFIHSSLHQFSSQETCWMSTRIGTGWHWLMRAPRCVSSQLHDQGHDTVAWNLPQWECWQHGNWQMLHKLPSLLHSHYPAQSLAHSSLGKYSSLECLYLIIEWFVICRLLKANTTGCMLMCQVLCEAQWILIFSFNSVTTLWGTTTILIIQKRMQRHREGKEDFEGRELVSGKTGMNEYSELYLVGNQQPRPVVNDEEGGHRTVCGSGSVCVWF